MDWKGTYYNLILVVVYLLIFYKKDPHFKSRIANKLVNDFTNSYSRLSLLWA